MEPFVRQFVDYCQYQVRTAPYWRAGMGIYVVGDDLLHVGSPTDCTGFAGTHTGWIGMRVVIRDRAPDHVAEDWDVISETTLWSPHGALSVHSLLGGTTDELADLSVRPGLVRIRAHARHRLHESVRTGADPPEQHELLVWPVTEETGHRTLRTDGRHGSFDQKRAAAAEYAMLDLIRQYDPHEERDPDLPRVTVVRRSAVPSPAADLARRFERRLPAGDREVHLVRTAAHTLEWRWVSATAPLPDARPAPVRLEVVHGVVTIRHEEVIGRHAVMLGLVWDYLLETDPADPPAWEPALRAAATEQAERRERLRLDALEEARSWGGTPPTGRMRSLSHRARALAARDRPLLDRLAAMAADDQVRIAVWAARAAMRVSGLDRLDWIAGALEEVDAGRGLPSAFTELGGLAAVRRLLEDPAAPRTPVTLPDGSSNLQAVAALPALIALAHDDPLGAAVDAVHAAANTVGEDGYAEFLIEVWKRVA
ncbi:hypothetical protein GCM10009557_35750 [Virgisporangium ochraceum]